MENESNKEGKEFQSLHDYMARTTSYEYGNDNIEYQNIIKNVPLIGVCELLKFIYDAAKNRIN